MNRGDIILATFIAAAVLGATALFLATVSVAADASVFDVTDPDRGIYRMHAPLLSEEAQP